MTAGQAELAGKAYPDAILQMIEITKDFPGVRALDGVTMTVVK